MYVMCVLLVIWIGYGPKAVPAGGIQTERRGELPLPTWLVAVEEALGAHNVSCDVSGGAGEGTGGAGNLRRGPDELSGFRARMACVSELMQEDREGTRRGEVASALAGLKAEYEGSKRRYGEEPGALTGALDELEAQARAYLSAEDHAALEIGPESSGQPGDEPVYNGNIFLGLDV